MSMHYTKHKVLISVMAFTLILVLGSGAAKAQDSQDKNWCRTYDAFAAKYPEMLIDRDGVCATQGGCDIAANRDAMIPDGTTPIITIRLKFHVFRETDGTNAAATQADVDQQMVTLNNIYLPFRIQFIYDTDFINDSDYRSMSDAEMAPMKTAYAEDPASQCNIFVTWVEGTYSEGTFPWTPDALTVTGGVTMHEGHFNPTDDVLAHELGHNFGLLHTHRGVTESPDPYPDCDWGCYEHTNSNSDETGDYCSDTPPTPTSGSCSPHGGTDDCTDDDPWGATWPENYMSYGGPGCWDAFSGQQTGRMHCWYDAELTSWLSAEPPVALCTDVTVAADENCEALTASIDDGSYDPEGLPLTYSQTPAGPYPLGETFCTLIVTDADGQSDMCGATVTVVDVTPPDPICPSDITAATDPDECSAVVGFIIDATDNCPGVTVAASPPSGSTFPLGITEVEVLATDASGNTDRCYFDVTVVDITPPDPICPSDITAATDPDECSAVVGFTIDATDNCPGVTVAASPPSGSTFPLGMTEVEVLATDASGNTDVCHFEVTVVDTQKPVVSCPEEITVFFRKPGEAVADYQATATDNCDADPTVWCVPPSGSAFPIGENLVNCYAEDEATNRDTCEFKFHLAYVDIKPRSCPNPLNVKPYGFDEIALMNLGGTDPADPVDGESDRKPPVGVLPVAILGLDDFDVMDIVIESIRLEGVEPLRHDYMDVAEPAEGEEDYCACTNAGPDGLTDLTLKFNREKIIDALGTVANGDVVQLILTGELIDGTPLFGGDCVVIRGPHNLEATGDLEQDSPSATLVGSNPNPFNPVTTLSFDLSQPADYTMTILNITGQVVQTFRGAGHSGLNRVVWDASKYASGMYFYRLIALGQTDTKKMMLLK